MTDPDESHFRCCLCHALYVEVHHIIPEADGGQDTEDNAAPLCPSCHETYGANPEKRKFIREVRDFWVEICERRFISDTDQLNSIKEALKDVASFCRETRNLLLNQRILHFFSFFS